MDRLIWHYTNGIAIDEIVSTGVIRLATAGVPTSERAAAWFSINPSWDPSANRGNMSLKRNDYPVGAKMEIDLQKDIEVAPFDPDLMDREIGRYRIGVVPEAAPHGWEAFKKMSGIDRKLAQAMEEMDPREAGNPREWQASFYPVGRAMWRTVERLVSGVWIAHVELTRTHRASVS